ELASCNTCWKKEEGNGVLKEKYAQRGVSIAVLLLLLLSVICLFIVTTGTHGVTFPPKQRIFAPLKYHGAWLSPSLLVPLPRVTFTKNHSVWSKLNIFFTTSWSVFIFSNEPLEVSPFFFLPRTEIFQNHRYFFYYEIFFSPLPLECLFCFFLYYKTCLYYEKTGKERHNIASGCCCSANNTTINA
ncbi:hypothetical protein L9F63_023245, partial [Diploptera punctata]